MVALTPRLEATPLPKIRLRQRLFLPDVVEMKFRVRSFDGVPPCHGRPPWVEPPRTPLHEWTEWRRVPLRSAIEIVRCMLGTVQLEDYL